MSTFLGYNANLVAAATTPSTNQSSILSIMTGYGWQLVRQALLPTSIVGTATTPGNALDLNSTTSATGTVPVTVGAQTAGFTPIYMYVQCDNVNWATNAPMNFTLDYSANGSSWTTLQTWTNQIGWTPEERRKYTVIGATSQLYWRISISQVQYGTSLNLADWTLEDSSKNWLINYNFFDIIPPSGETIGNSVSREVLRWAFPPANTSISFWGIQESLVAFPQVNVVYATVAGSVPVMLGINTQATATASFATNIMTLQSTPTGGYITIGSLVSAAGVAANTYITQLLSGTINVIGSTYLLSTSPGTIATEAITTATYSCGATISTATTTMTLVSAPTIGAICVGQQMGFGLQYITALASGTVNVAGSTYTLSATAGTITTQSTSSCCPIGSIGGSASFATNVMTITVAPTSGSISLGQTVNAAGVAAGTTILSLASGTLNAIGSTYTLSTTPGTISAESFTTVNGHAIVFNGTGGTTLQNARGLYEVCKNDTRSLFTDYYWVWPTNNAPATGSGQFLAIQKTPTRGIVGGGNTAAVNGGANGNITLAGFPTLNCVAPTKSGYCDALALTSQQPYQIYRTIDAVNGWIYYLQVNNRGIALAIKTNAAFSAPLHACYGDNASALVQIPTADLAPYGLPCTISELLWGYDDVVANTGALAWGTHYWGVCQPHAGNGTWATYTNSLPENATFNGLSPFGKTTFPGQIQDFAAPASATSGWGGAAAGNYIIMCGETLFAGADSGQSFNIHKIGSIGSNSTTGYGWTYAVQTSGVHYARWVAPSFANLDWYKFSGSAPANEQILVAPVSDFTTTITTAGISSDTTINVVSTTGFPSAAWIYIDGEIIKYTSKTGTTFAGCTRAQYNTTAVNIPSGTAVNICGWWTYIQTSASSAGLVYSGYAIPT